MSACLRCKSKFTELNASLSVLHKKYGYCRQCIREKSGANKVNRQVPKSFHRFPCKCSGILPKRGDSNKFAYSHAVQHVFGCRVTSILSRSQKSANRYGYKPINSDTSHLVIRKMMQENSCVVCHNPLKWAFGRGKTPHLHHDHETGEIYGFTHANCNPIALQKRIFELEAEVKKLKQK